MDRLRRSFRSSFRRRDERGAEAGAGEEESAGGPSRMWPADEAAVKTNNCFFEVKYMGSVEVFESRGMQVCEEALKNLKNSKRRPIKGVLHISGDGLRVSDSDTKGLVLDQTIEKVSFCAPDRNYEKGFSYICRDGTTRRWLCHGFLASRDSGERLSHAVGCAFAICLEKKQKRDKDCSVQMSYDNTQNTFTRFGSFKQGSITERLQDPQGFKPHDMEPPPAPKEPISNPNALARPKASDLMYLRQASFRGLGKLSDSSPFKRQFSLRLNELPSTLARQARDNGGQDVRGETGPGAQFPGLAPTCQFSPIKEDAGDLGDLLSPVPALVTDPSQGPLTSLSPVSRVSGAGILLPTPCSRSPLRPSSRSPLEAVQEDSGEVTSPSFNPWDNVPDQPLSRTNQSASSEMASTNQGRPYSFTGPDTVAHVPLDDWLQAHQLSTLSLGQPLERSRPPGLVSTKSHSFDQSNLSARPCPGSSSLHPSHQQHRAINSQLSLHQEPATDPFDADWVNLAMRNEQKKSTNPFLQDTLKTFELKM